MSNNNTKIQIVGGKIKIVDGKIQLFTEYVCNPDIFKLKATFTGIKDCGCVGSISGKYYKLNPDAINGIAIVLRRTMPGDITQWESNYRMEFPGALQQYTPVPSALQTSCLASYDSCRSDCDDAESACISGCAGNPICEQACIDAHGDCWTACRDAGNACMDCQYFSDDSCHLNCSQTQTDCVAACGGDPACEDACGAAYGACSEACDRRSCQCYDATDCTCGAHFVVQCVIPDPAFPSTKSNVFLWVSVSYCGTAANIDCRMLCAAAWAACMDACDPDDGPCINDCANASTACDTDCEGLGECGAGLGNFIGVFGWTDNDATGLFGTNDNTLSCGSFTPTYGHEGTLDLETIDNPAP